MSDRPAIGRRQFLKRGIAAVGAGLAAPHVVASTVLGKGGAVAPSERIVLGAMGVGGRGGYVLGCMLREPDVRCVAIASKMASRVNSGAIAAVKPCGYRSSA